MDVNNLTKMELPTLIYFGVYGRGEMIRMLLHHANIDYNDKRVSFSEWKQMKGNLIHSQLPVWVEEDGVQRNQSISILRYVGMKSGYYSTDPDEAYHIDNVLDEYNDVIAKLYPIHMKKDYNNEDKRKMYFDALETFATTMESRLQKRKTEFISLDRITIADFALASVMFCQVDNPNCSDEEFRALAIATLNNKPRFKTYVDNKLKPALASYLESRPSSTF
jgi:glutathione S-transferase